MLKEVVDAMSEQGISPAEQWKWIELLAAVLHLGTLQFDPAQTEEAALAKAISRVRPVGHALNRNPNNIFFSALPVWPPNSTRVMSMRFFRPTALESMSQNAARFLRSLSGTLLDRSCKPNSNVSPGFLKSRQSKSLLPVIEKNTLSRRLFAAEI